MQIDPPETNRRRNMILWAGGFVLVVAAAVWLADLRSPLPPSFEIKNFRAGAEIYSPENDAWVPLQRGQLLRSTDKIRTGPDSEVDLQVRDQIQMRLKENSRLEGRGPKWFERKSTYRLHLNYGKLLGSTEEGFENCSMEIRTPVLVAAVRGTQFQVEYHPESLKSTVEVLRGTVEVQGHLARERVLVQGLQKTEVLKGGAPAAPVQITRQEWDILQETYDLSRRSALEEAEQLDLSKEAGSFFDYVFDHGTFYTPGMGFADREFARDRSSGQVNLQMKYDVFPPNCYVGTYFKIRDLDLSKYESISFDARGDPKEGWPDEFRIEFKTKNGIVAAFSPKHLTARWEPFRFSIHQEKTSMITEMSVVASNAKVGGNKKGSIYFRNVSLHPVNDGPSAEPPPA